MAKFLTTVGNSYYIEQIIINSEKSLTLVTPYLKLSRNLIERISDADKKGVKITLIYGKNELAQKERNKLDTINNLEIFYCENLHAKCYHNDNSMIITSMNLYEFSERNNREMGIIIEKEDDIIIFNDTLKEIDSIKNSSILEKSFNDTKKVHFDDLVQLHTDYDKKSNFHLPSINAILTNKYPKHNIEFEDSITVHDFPFDGAYLEINGKINLTINNQLKYEEIKNINKGEIEKLLPGIRFYWNYKKLYIYTEKDFKPEINLTGLKEKVDKYMSIIEILEKDLQYN